MSQNFFLFHDEKMADSGIIYFSPERSEVEKLFFSLICSKTYVFCQMRIHFQCFLSLESLQYLPKILFLSLSEFLKVTSFFSAEKKLRFGKKRYTKPSKIIDTGKRKLKIQIKLQFDDIPIFVYQKNLWAAPSLSKKFNCHTYHSYNIIYLPN